MIVQTIYAVVDKEEDYNVAYFISEKSAYDYIKHMMLVTFGEELESATYMDAAESQEIINEDIVCLKSKHSVEEIKEFVDNYYDVYSGYCVDKIYVED